MTRMRSALALVLLVWALGSTPGANTVSDPDFFWLPPTVATTTVPTGPFDPNSLDDLAIEVCELSAAASCIAGPPVETFTSTTSPTPSRIRLDVNGEFYTVNWLTGPSTVDIDAFYRVRVLKGDVELGSVDVDFVRNTPGVATVDPARYIGIVRGQQLTIRFRLQQPTARTRVRINEVESNGGVPGDWIELHNSAAVPISLGGYIVKDNDNTHVYTLPGDATIPAHGYYVVDEAALNFGLGANEEARFFAPDGTLVDSYAWTSHAPTTYGRCPDATGAFDINTTSTKGAANDCSVVIRINEVESNGGTPGDWVELYNPGPRAADVGGFAFSDNDNTHLYVLPSAIVPANGYLLLEEAAFGFGLGGADSARLFRPDGSVADSISWAAHAATTYGRCPNGTGSFLTTAAATKGASNSCLASLSAVRINEVESNGGSPGDWVELYNTGSAPADLSGAIFRDNDDTHTYAIPAGTMIAAGGYYLVEEAAIGFGLGGADSARLFDQGGVLVDSYTWAAHAPTTYGRCPNGTGAFATTVTVTKGSANTCTGEPPPGPVASPWPGDPSIQDAAGAFGGNMSGLMSQGTGTPAPGTLWAVQNNPGTLFRLVWDATSSTWIPDTTNGWSTGKALRYPTGLGNPDAEGVTFGAGGLAGGVYVATERNNDVSGVSRNAILRFDVSASGATLTATHEWNLTALLPAVGSNLGIEGITFVPDAVLIAQGFADESQGLNVAYNPAAYPNHAGGLFFVGVEGNGSVYAFALDHTAGTASLIATIASGFPGVMEVQFDPLLNALWAACDDTCNGRSALLTITAGTGTFGVTRLVERPASMPNLNNEGFAVAPLEECVADRRPAFWADDSETGGHAIRRGSVTCSTP